jgi:hypothetical protein
MTIRKIIYGLIPALLFNYSLNAKIIEDAELAFKIKLVKPPTSMPQTVAYIPVEKKYYVADGGLAPMGSAYEAPISKSLIHTFDENGKYIESTRAGFDNRSIYFNERSSKLETITYNISSAAGFAPMTGIFSLSLDEEGLLTGKSDTIANSSPAFGSASTMPSYDPKNNIYYAKQERTNSVFAISAENYQLLNDIKLDFKTPKAEHHDVADSFIAFTGIAEEEFILLDVDHKRFLIYDVKGNYKGQSKLPGNLKIRSKNHFNGLGYTLNGYYFLYIDSEGEYGTYYAFKVLS